MLGTFDPLVDKHGLVVDTAKVEEWIKKGAKPTNTVARMLKGQGIKGMENFIVEMKDRKVKNPKEEPAPPAAAPAPAAPEASAEAPVAEEAAPAPTETPAEEAPKEEVDAPDEEAATEEKKEEEKKASVSRLNSFQ